MIINKKIYDFINRGLNLQRTKKGGPYRSLRKGETKFVQIRALDGQPSRLPRNDELGLVCLELKNDGRLLR